MPRIKIYALYKGDGGSTISANSTYYYGYSRTVYHVIAFTVKQAVYLAAKSKWTDGKRPGVVEMAKGGDDLFLRFDMSTGPAPLILLKGQARPLKHGEKKLLRETGGVLS